MRAIESYMAEGAAAKAEHRKYLFDLGERARAGKALTKDEALDLAVAFLEGCSGFHTEADVAAMVRARWSAAK